MNAYIYPLLHITNVKNKSLQHCNSNRKTSNRKCQVKHEIFSAGKLSNSLQREAVTTLSRWYYTLQDLIRISTRAESALNQRCNYQLSVMQLRF